MPSKLHLLWGVSPALLRGARRRVAGAAGGLARPAHRQDGAEWALMLLLLLIGIQSAQLRHASAPDPAQPLGHEDRRHRHPQQLASAACWPHSCWACPLRTDWLHELQLRLVFASPAFLVARQGWGRCSAPPPSSTIWGAGLIAILSFPVLMRRHSSAAHRLRRRHRARLHPAGDPETRRHPGGAGGPSSRASSTEPARPHFDHWASWLSAEPGDNDQARQSLAAVPGFSFTDGRTLASSPPLAAAHHPRYGQRIRR